MSTYNQLKLAGNQNCFKVARIQKSTISADDKPIYKNTVVKIVNGIKKG